MKKIECIIRPEVLKELEGKLRGAGIGGMTITEVKGFGRETTRPEAYLILPKTKIEIYTSDEHLEELISIIRDVCSTGGLGDGKLAVLPLDDVVRIRTGETGDSAIY